MDLQTKSNQYAVTVRPSLGVLKVGGKQIVTATSRRGIFKFITTKPSTPAYTAPQADNREGPIKKKVKRKKIRAKSNYETRQIQREEEEDKRRDLKKKRWRDKVGLKCEEHITPTHPERKHTMKVTSKRKKTRKSWLETVKHWTIRDNKKKCRSRPWRTQQSRKKEKATRQFKQLKTQTLRFNKEASSPAARMVLMRSNKHFKPGD